MQTVEWPSWNRRFPCPSFHVQLNNFKSFCCRWAGHLVTICERAILCRELGSAGRTRMELDDCNLAQNLACRRKARREGQISVAAFLGGWGCLLMVKLLTVRLKSSTSAVVNNMSVNWKLCPCQDFSLSKKKTVKFWCFLYRTILLLSCTVWHVHFPLWCLFHSNHGQIRYLLLLEKCSYTVPSAQYEGPMDAFADTHCNPIHSCSLCLCVPLSSNQNKFHVPSRNVF